jgi:hypothetical protein
VNLTGSYQDVEIDRRVIVYHMSVKKEIRQTWALPENTTVLRWAKLHEEFLIDFGAIVRALRKYSTMFTAKGSSAKIAGLASQFSAETTALGTPFQSNPTGSMLISETGNEFKVIDAGTSKIVGPDDGRYFSLMVCAGTGVPETYLVGDPSTGNLATAKELSGPFLVLIQDRQTAWVDTLRTIFARILGPQAQDAQQYITSLISAFTLDGKTPAGTLRARDFIVGIYEALEIDPPDRETLEKMVAELETITRDTTFTPSQPTLDAFVRLAGAAQSGGLPGPVVGAIGTTRDQFRKEFEEMRTD